MSQFNAERRAGLIAANSDAETKMRLREVLRVFRSDRVPATSSLLAAIERGLIDVW